MELPSSQHPRLLLEWTMVARVQNTKGNDPLPKKRLIARSYPSGDTSGLSCWAWYTMVGSCKPRHCPLTALRLAPLVIPLPSIQVPASVCPRHACLCRTC